MWISCEFANKSSKQRTIHGLDARRLTFDVDDVVESSRAPTPEVAEEEAEGYTGPSE